MKRQTIIILIANWLIFLLMFFAMLFYLNRLELFAKIIAYLCIFTFSILTTVFAILKKEGLFRSLFVCNVVTFVIILFFLVFNLLGVFDSFNDLSKIKQIIIDFGAYGYLIFIALQLFQVIILPAPGFLFYLAGTAIYGPLVSFLLSYGSVVVGSVIAFYIGRLLGKPIVYWCVGKKQTEKYLNLLGNKGNFLFFLMQLLPFFPDDILCMIAGLTKMRFSFFFICILLVRPIYIGAVCFLGTGEVIPFTGWGIYCWIGIFLICILGFIIYLKYQNKLTENPEKEK